MRMKDVWKCIITEAGEQCVETDSMTQTHVLFADLSVTSMFYSSLFYHIGSNTREKNK